MSDEGIRDLLEREAERWLDHQRVAVAMRKEREDRHTRNVEVAKLWARAIFAVACIAAAVRVVQVVSR